jgi:hypothetical protein
MVMALYGGRGGRLQVRGAAWSDDEARGRVVSGGWWLEVRSRRCGALADEVDDPDFSLVTGHGYGGSGMAPWCMRDNPGGLRCGGAAPVGSDVRH